MLYTCDTKGHKNCDCTKNQRQHVYLLNINRQALSQYIALHCNNRFELDFKQNNNICTHFRKRPKLSNKCFDYFRTLLKKTDSDNFSCRTHGFRAKSFQELRCRGYPMTDIRIFSFENLERNGRTDGLDH